jgi:hypothetical protein
MSVLRTISYIGVAYNYLCAYDYDNCDIYIILSVLVISILIVNLIIIAMLLNLDKNDVSGKSFRTRSMSIIVSRGRREGGANKNT